MFEVNRFTAPTTGSLLHESLRVIAGLSVPDVLEVVEVRRGRAKSSLARQRLDALADGFLTCVFRIEPELEAA